MPPFDRFVPSFAAEPPQEPLPTGRWAERLRQQFLEACEQLDTGEDELGEIGEVGFYPDRTWHGRTYVPATAPTGGGFELFGYVRFVPGLDGGEPSELQGFADYTDETAVKNPDWTLDLCDEVIGRWRGEIGAVATMTLVWGRPLVAGGVIATAELAGLAVDQCRLIEDSFTLLAPDDYRGDLLDIKLWNSRTQELASESLYDADEG